jgi:hypothetical protein
LKVCVVPTAYAETPKLNRVEDAEVQFLKSVNPFDVVVANPEPEFNKVKLEVGETLTTIESGSVSEFPFELVTVKEAPVVVTVL